MKSQWPYFEKTWQLMKIEWDVNALSLWRRNLRECVEEFGKKTGEKILSDLEQKQKRLLKNPLLGHREAILMNCKKEYRSLLLRNKRYKIIYYYDEDKDVIFIADFWDSKMDPKRLANRTKK